MSDDIVAIVALSEASGLFDSDGIELIRERLSDYEGGNDNIWFAAINEKIQRVIYCIREPMTDGIRNMEYLNAD